MSKFPNQLLLVSVSSIALIGVAVGMSERAAERAAEAAHQAELAAHQVAAADHAEEAPAEDVAATSEPEEAPAEEVAATSEPDETPVEEVTIAETPAEEPAAEAVADTTPHGHGDPGTGPIASIIAGAAVAQSVDSPAIDATGVTYGLGREALPEEIASWDIDVRPDGLGLPEGSGDVLTGDEVFAENCAVCHGDFAEGVDRWPVLAGGQGSLTNDRPIKTIGSYWPYLSTVWDYVNRAMPFGNAQSLTPDEVYAITAYLLYSNDIVDEDFTLSHENFTEVRLPNEENFFTDDRAEGELAAFGQEPCMENCKESVEITMRAAVLDVTPEGDGGGIDLEGGAAPAQEASAPAAEPAAEETAATPEAPTEAAPAEAPTEAAAPAAAAGPDPAMVAAGEKVFAQCKTCHQVGEGAKNRVGPVLTGIVGHPAGAIDGFRYSNPMKAAGEEGLVWTHEELAAFLADPKAYMRGTKMSFKGLGSDEDIAAVIAYLESVAP